MTDNCSNSFSALYVFKAFTVLKPTSKIVARNKNGDAIKLRLVVAKGWGLQSIQKSIQQDSKDFPTQRLLWDCPWSCLLSHSLSLPPDVVQRLSPMLFAKLFLRLPEVTSEVAPRVASKVASQIDDKVTLDGAPPGCLASLPNTTAKDLQNYIHMGTC